MKRFITIHGHFYQPPRENPWLEEVELQDSAYPFHDWNARVTAEAYAPNASSRILNGENHIIGIVNNYSRISFNFGPTLLSWLQRHEPEVYGAVIEADRESRERFSGHGAAIAQAYNHIIMPLANGRDKRTQVVWGLADFEYRFGRKPEGMWLPETAVDLETLDILAEFDVRFTILAPSQAGRIRRIGAQGGAWRDVPNGSIDPKRPYLQHLPSGGSIVIFFYDGPISRDIAFGDLLRNGEMFADRLSSAFVENGDASQLVHVATDGETYGHHHRFGDMAMAYCLHRIEERNRAAITIYGEYLDKNPPEYEVEIIENTSWSCVHGVERWRADCGCATGMNKGWHQKWRGPLREAMDRLRDDLASAYEDRLAGLVRDPWAARDDYISLILERTPERRDDFLSRHAARALEAEEKVRVLMLLEMQRHALLMYTSCGWFFDELSGIEAVQVIQYAARAIQLARNAGGGDLEEPFVRMLERAPSNVSGLKNGAVIYNATVGPTILDLKRVAMHFGVASLFEDFGDMERLYTYVVEVKHYERMTAGRQKLAVATIHVRSEITMEEETITFAILHLGDHNVAGGARPYSGPQAYEAVRSELKATFERGDISAVIRLIDQHFPDHNISLWHLFRDKQREILEQFLDDSAQEIEVFLRQIYERQYLVMQTVAGMRANMPRYFAMVLEFVINTDIRRVFETDEVDAGELERLVDEIQKWSIRIDRQTLSFLAAGKIDSMIERWANDHQDAGFLASIAQLLWFSRELSLDVDAWRAQIVLFHAIGMYLPAMEKRADAGDAEAIKWIDLLRQVGDSLRVNVDSPESKG